jgi:hypothetical protein
MSKKDDEQRSVSRSVSSEASATSALTVIHFNPFDELFLLSILFSAIHTFRKTLSNISLFSLGYQFHKVSSAFPFIFSSKPFPNSAQSPSASLLSDCCPRDGYPTCRDVSGFSKLGLSKFILPWCS